MTDTEIVAAIMRITDLRDYPPLTASAHVALTPKQVTLWRIVNKDPDEIAEITGVLESETPQLWNMILPDSPRVTAFPKWTPAGVTVWRLA